MTPAYSIFIMGWVIGLEPTTSRATIWRSSQLSYTHHMARLKGLEPLTHCLEGSCSIHLSYKRTTKINGAGDGSRTHTTSLEGWNSTAKLHPHICDCVILSQVVSKVNTKIKKIEPIIKTSSCAET